MRAQLQVAWQGGRSGTLPKGQQGWAAGGGTNCGAAPHCKGRQGLRSEEEVTMGPRHTAATSSSMSSPMLMHLTP